MGVTADHNGGGRVAVGLGRPKIALSRRWRTRIPAPAVRLISANETRLATLRLATLRPDLSSSKRLWRWQALVLSVLVLAVVTGMIVAPHKLALVVTIALAPPFFAVYLLRLLAVCAAFARRRATRTRGAAIELRAAGCDLPTYAVLVALYDEADIVPALVDALLALDYPVGRLAIRLVVEEDDVSTRRALGKLILPPHIAILVVPRGMPRTKPRALNVALDATPGDLVVVYDAEDLPEPDQLRKAASAFRDAPADLACVQARLNTFNPDESWLARQFTIEYSALFDLILPALERYRLPVPLGGTSNHFRRAVLQRVLAWDPYNVTEDADLGIRLARYGYSVGTIDSTTWEEAPPRFGIWLRQRTRWLKGWMQTYLVHMRQPRRLLGELGWWGFAGLQVLMGAMIASALVHPWFYVLLAQKGLEGSSAASVASGIPPSIAWLAFANLLLGYLSVALVGAVAVWRRGRKHLVIHVLLVPVYWLAISLAAYRALGQMVTAPFHWEKTQHRARRHGVGRLPSQSQPS